MSVDIATITCCPRCGGNPTLLDGRTVTRKGQDVVRRRFACVGCAHRWTLYFAPQDYWGPGKLTDAQRAEIRQRKARGESGGKLARQFGVTPAAVRKLLKQAPKSVPETKPESCSGCYSAEKPIHRRIAITNEQGVVLDRSAFCKECWNTGPPSGGQRLKTLFGSRFSLTRVPI